MYSTNQVDWAHRHSLGESYPSVEMQSVYSGREDTLEEGHAIKLCFKLGKMPQKRMDRFRLLFDHLA